MCSSVVSFFLKFKKVLWFLLHFNSPPPSVWQPSHLKVKPELADVPTKESYPIYGAPESRFCPARVYEYTDGRCVKMKMKRRRTVTMMNCHFILLFFFVVVDFLTF